MENFSAQICRPGCGWMVEGSIAVSWRLGVLGGAQPLLFFCGPPALTLLTRLGGWFFAFEDLVALDGGVVIDLGHQLPLVFIKRDRLGGLGPGLRRKFDRGDVVELA